VRLPRGRAVTAEIDEVTPRDKLYGLNPVREFGNLSGTLQYHYILVPGIIAGEVPFTERDITHTVAPVRTTDLLNYLSEGRIGCHEHEIKWSEASVTAAPHHG
jgi:hypothetical protein